MRHWFIPRLTARAAAAGAVAVTALALGPTGATTPVRADGWTVSLSASSTTPVNGTTVTLTATANATVTGSLFSILVFDHTTGANVAACVNGTTCSATVGAYTNAAHAYIAYVALGNVPPLDPPVDDQATSSVVTVTWGAPPTPLPSDSCTTPTLTVFDGYVGSVYARLIVAQNGNQTTVCYRVDAGSVREGGDVTVTAAPPPTPSFDTNIGGCEPGPNLVPGPHPEQNNSYGAGGVLIPVFLDVYASSTTAMVCVAVDGIPARVVIPSPVSGTPIVTQTPDPPPAPAPPSPVPGPGPAGYPSSGCLASGGASAVSILDANVDGQQNWLSAWPNGTQTHLCIRTAGPQGIFGGMLTITDPPTDLGVTPVLSAVPGGANTTVCPNVIAEGPPNQLLATSNPGGTTVTLCVIAGNVNEAVTVGFTGTPQVPFPTFPTFAPDPDTI